MTGELTKEVDRICAVIAKTVPVESIYLFGSHAYGTPRDDSDIDIYMVVPDEGPRPIDSMKKARRALAGTYTIPLDLVCARSSEFENRRKDHLFEGKIYSDGVKIYG